MLLSRIRLSSRASFSRELGSLLASPYRLHRAVWDLFADHPDRRRDFLYRLDWAGGKPILLALSERPPRPVENLWEVETKALSPVLRTGERLRFSLRANPIVTRNGDRHDVVMEAKKRLTSAGVPKSAWPTVAQLAQQEGTAWLARRGERRGFAVRAEDIVVESYEVHDFKKSRGAQVRFATCDFQGLLTVTEVELFLRTLRQGLGPAKGFGCGLLLIRRAGEAPSSLTTEFAER